MADKLSPAHSSDLDADWLFYAVVGTTVAGGHTLAAFGPRASALDALTLAVNAINHTAYSLLEQGVEGNLHADTWLVERLPITSFTIRRHDPDTKEPDDCWMLTGRKHYRGGRPQRGAA